MVWLSGARMKPPSRHINATQRAGMAIVLLAVLTIGCAVLEVDLGDGVVEIVVAAIYALGAVATGMGSMSAGRDVAKAWKGPKSAETP